MKKGLSLKANRKRKVFLALFLAALTLLLALPLVMSHEKAVVEKTQAIPVLGFHHIVSDEDKIRSMPFDTWSASISSFEKQMKYLYDNGYTTITADEYYDWYTGKKEFNNKTVLLTFDDSYYSTVELAKPVLEKYSFKAAVFVIGKSIPKEAFEYSPPSKEHIPLEKLKDDDTLNFYSHFYGLHKKTEGEALINTYSAEDIKTDLQKAETAVSVDYVAYPYGIYTDIAAEALEESSVKLAFSYSQHSPSNRNEDRYKLSRYSVNAYTPMFLYRYYLNK